MLKLEELLNHWKTILTALLALLVVIPSVINSVNDIWIAWNGLPIGEKEKINSKLFTDHWKEDPIHTKQLIIEGAKGKVPVTIDIYKNGDIFVDYGRFTQWFPYKDLNTSIATTTFSILPEANAGFFDKISKNVKSVGSKPVKVVNKEEKQAVVREKTFSDGSIERQVINKNTGKVESAETIEPKPNSSSNVVVDTGETVTEPIEVIKLPTKENSSVEVYSIKAKPVVDGSKPPVKPSPAKVSADIESSKTRSSNLSAEDLLTNEEKLN